MFCYVYPSLIVVGYFLPDRVIPQCTEVSYEALVSHSGDYTDVNVGVRLFELLKARPECNHVTDATGEEDEYVLHIGMEWLVLNGFVLEVGVSQHDTFDEFTRHNVGNGCFEQVVSVDDP